MLPFAGPEQAVLWAALSVVARRQESRQVLTFTDREIAVRRGRETVIAALLTCDDQWPWPHHSRP